MVRLYILVILCSLGQMLYAQDIQVGIGFSFDIAINFPESEKYKVSLPEFGNTTSGFSMDLFTKLSLKKGINIYPTFIFTVSKGLFSIENKGGDFIPEGYTVSKPYSTVGNGWTVDHYSSDYEYFLSDGYVSQLSFGTLITKSLFMKEFEIGTGIFIKSKKAEIENFQAYDEYFWSHSSGTQYDYYDYYDTHVSSTSFETETIRTSAQISIPFILQYTTYVNNLALGGSFLAYVGQDTYYSLRVTMGLNIKRGQ